MSSDIVMDESREDENTDNESTGESENADNGSTGESLANGKMNEKVKDEHMEEYEGDEESMSDDEPGSEPATDEEVEGNPGWADSMLKVLKAPVKSGNFILSKAKKDADIIPRKEKEVEIVDSTGKPVPGKNLKPEIKQKSSYKEERQKKLERQQKKYKWESMCRVEPDITQMEKEKQLKTIATKGVVHLFNAVEKHQHTMEPTEKDYRRKSKKRNVKGTFMDMLKECAKKDVKDPALEKSKHQETWSILREDYMMGAGVKDWDKESDTET